MKRCALVLLKFREEQGRLIYINLINFLYSQRLTLIKKDLLFVGKYYKVTIGK